MDASHTAGLLSLSSCAGSVLLEDVACGRIAANDSGSLHIANATTFGLIINNCRTVMENSSPVLTTTDRNLDGIVGVEIAGTLGENYVLVLGAPTPPTAIAGYAGQLTVRNPSLAAFGLLEAQGTAQNQFPIPNIPALVSCTRASKPSPLNPTKALGSRIRLHSPLDSSGKARRPWSSRHRAP